MAEGLAKAFVELGRILAKFQMIELTLKIFITKDNIAASASKGLHLKPHSTLDLDSYSLGKSLKRVKKLKLIKSEKLLGQLTSLKKHRDFVAHKGFLMVSNLPDSDKKYFLGHEANPLNYQKLNHELEEVIAMLKEEHFKEQSET